LNYKTQPPWEFLLSASRNSLQSYELSRLSHAANLRKEITQLLDSWLEENTAAMFGALVDGAARTPRHARARRPVHSGHIEWRPQSGARCQEQNGASRVR